MMDRKTAIFMALGFECVGLVMVGVWIGEYLDKERGWGGNGTTVAVMGSVILWIAHMLLEYRRLEKSENSGDKPENQ